MPDSVASGRKLYERLCASCHGVTGNGVSELAATLAGAGKTKPSDLTDDKWDYGATDGEMFIGIRDGVGRDGAMKGLNGKPGVGPREMWHIVNYVRSIGPKQL
jgi:mono/diheme cytochrome c family protein